MSTEIIDLTHHLEGARRAVDALALLTRSTPEELDLLGAHEVAQLVGWKPSSISAALSRGRLPTPYARLACGPIWTRAQIDLWMARRAAAAR